MKNMEQLMFFCWQNCVKEQFICFYICEISLCILMNIVPTYIFPFYLLKLFNEYVYNQCYYSAYIAGKGQAAH
jgi:hypothetical protein